MNLRSPSLNLADPVTLDAPTGLDRDGRSRDEASGTVHLFAWRMVDISFGPGDRRYFFSVLGSPSLGWFLRSARDRMIEAIESGKARIRRLIEEERTRFLGLVGAEFRFETVHVRISDYAGRLELVGRIRPTTPGPDGWPNLHLAALGDAPTGPAIALEAWPSPPVLPPLLCAGGKTGLHTPLN